MSAQQQSSPATVKPQRRAPRKGVPGAQQSGSTTVSSPTGMGPFPVPGSPVTPMATIANTTMSGSPLGGNGGGGGSAASSSGGGVSIASRLGSSDDAASASAARNQLVSQMVANELKYNAPLNFPGLDISWMDQTSNSSPTVVTASPVSPRENIDREKEIIMLENQGWRAAQKGKIKTMHAALFLCLNIGVDPQDVDRIDPCPKLECWVDPTECEAKFPSKGSEEIAGELEKQYRVLQKDAVYKKCVEMGVDDVKYALDQIRKKAKDGRVIIHYNGHGMLKATFRGEIWFFNDTKQKTEYVPLSIEEISAKVGTPTLYVLDCNCAGSILRRWKMLGLTERRPKDILICACDGDQTLPMNPLLPADMLTACLTTPVKMVLEWYVHYSHRVTLLPHVTLDMVRNIPGDINDRKKPLGELHFIFNAITDTIGWTTTTREEFYRYYRHDVLVKTLFRNFFLAEKLMREVGCRPMIHPEIAENTHTHPIWDAWEVALESVLVQLPKILNHDMTENTSYEFQPTTFFSDQLTAFEYWVTMGDVRNEKPEQLPSIILALSQVVYRPRALMLLGQYLETGHVAVHNALYCGLLPYLVRLTSSREMALMLAPIWLQLLRTDPDGTCLELARAAAEKQFVSLFSAKNIVVALTINDPIPPSSAASSTNNSSSPPPAGSFSTTAKQSTSQAPVPSSASAPGSTSPGPSMPPVQYLYVPTGSDISTGFARVSYILCQMIQNGGDHQAISCWNTKLFGVVAKQIEENKDEQVQSWCCLLLSTMISSLRLAKSYARSEFLGRHNMFFPLLQEPSSIVRASCCTLLGSMLGVRVDVLSEGEQREKLYTDCEILKWLCAHVYDPSTAVRMELCCAAAQLLHFYGPIVFGGPPKMEQILSHNGNQFIVLGGDLSMQTISALNANRISTNPIFHDTNDFTTSMIHRDEPSVSIPLDKSKIVPQALALVRDMVHDSAVLLSHMAYGCDHRVSHKAYSYIRSLAKGSDLLKPPPGSLRVQEEASRSLLVSTSSVGGMNSPLSFSVVSNSEDQDIAVTDKERLRERLNQDLSRQIIHETLLKTFLPPSSEGANLANNGLIGGAAGGSVPQDLFSMLKQPPSSIPLFPPSSQHDSIVAGQFRLLEPEVLLAESSGRMSLIRYNDRNGSASVVQEFRHRSELHTVCLVNDLAPNPGVLAVDRGGVITLYTGLSQPKVRATMSLTVNPSTGPVDTKVSFRQSDGVLLVGGSREAIDMVSLVQERICTSLAIPGETLSALSCVTGGSSVILAGFTDGGITMFDDRQKSGNTAAVCEFPANSAGVAVTGGKNSRVLSMAVTEYDTNVLYCVTPTFLKIYDVRRPKQIRKSVDITTTAAPSKGNFNSRIASSFGGSGTGTKTSIRSSSISWCSPQIVTYSSDGTVDFYGVNGESIAPKPMKTRGLGMNTNTSSGDPCCFVHPRKTAACFGSELLTLH